MAREGANYPTSPAEARLVEEFAMPRYASKYQAAQRLQISERTIRNWIGQGYIRGFRLGPRRIVVDLDEIEAMLAVTPATKVRDGRKVYGKKATIVDISNVVLPESGQ